MSFQPHANQELPILLKVVGFKGMSFQLHANQLYRL